MTKDNISEHNLLVGLIHKLGVGNRENGIGQ
jgi:hypothetical protein